MHADIPLSAPGSGLFGMLLAMLGQTVGFPVPEGGAGRLAQALVDRFTAKGGILHLGTRAERVLTDRRRVVGVLTSTGNHHRVRAVVADVAAPALYGGLVRWDELPASMLARMSRFELDPAHREGGLGAVGSGAVVRPAPGGTGHGAHRGLPGRSSG